MYLAAGLVSNMKRRKSDSRFKNAKMLNTTSHPNIGKTTFATTRLRSEAIAVPIKRRE